MKVLRVLCFIFVPSRIKIWWLRSRGHNVAKSAYIGFSYLDVDSITLHEDSYIGHGNSFTRMKCLVIGAGGRVNRWNHFTSAGNGDGMFALGERSAVTLRHYIDCSGGVVIGSDVIFAGHRSTVFTHSKGAKQRMNYFAPVVIGDWCYIGSNTCIVPGFKLGDHCFVGMGSVLVGDMSASSYKLIAGSPAVEKKELSKDCGYFASGPICQPHVRSVA
ncbi:acyltransferase [Algiphilus sp.]|uniref:acyltransferase n=1 Tax=Algiphilus sp. TaxID=1872431 RepID=UPI003C7A7E17